MAANYLPVLLSSVNVNAASSDDSDIGHNSHVSSQVDYLSHHWREEDVWRSWRSMTRQKNEIANGLRLENASWRTWWQQRNALQTVSPETLNWLKDSDVTWLYGPFHTSADASQPTLRRTSSTHPSVRSSTPPPSPNSNTLLLPKSILKHRTVTDLLVSALPTPNPKTDLLDVALLGKTRADESLRETQQGLDIRQLQTRPQLLHTRSETNILERSPFRTESPPRIMADDVTHHPSLQNRQTPTDTTLAPTELAATRKHISFNTFVEQCIAIEKPSQSIGSYTHTASNYPSISSQYGERSSIAETYGRSHWNHEASSRSDSEIDSDGEEESDEFVNGSLESDEEDAPIEIKPRSRSSSYSLTRAAFSFPSTPIQANDFEDAQQGSGSLRERVTIAPIAPTILKSSSSSFIPSAGPANATEHTAELRRSISHTESPISVSNTSDVKYSLDGDEGDVPLLWVPPVGRGYDRNLSVKSSEPLLLKSKDLAIITPPEDHSLADDYFYDEREGRTRERQQVRKPKGDVKDRLSPGQASSSTTPSSSRSRSRSRNRNGFLSPSPDSRERGRSRSRSGSSTRDEEESPDVTDDRFIEGREEGRGRRLTRTLGHRISDWNEEADQIGQGSRSTSASYRSNLTDRSGVDGLDRRSEVHDSDVRASSANGPAVAGTIAGIRGYIGSIWKG